MKFCARPDILSATAFWRCWYFSRCAAPTATGWPACCGVLGRCSSDRWRLNWAVLGVMVTIVSAAFDEMHQSTIPSRTGRWQDVVLDTCGAVVLQVGFYVWAKRAYRGYEKVGTR